ncbi:MAG: pre-16S rRNA-processing nuclease YqgF [Bacteroidota bacterium]
MPTVIAVDPGRDKCGIAIVSSEAVLFRAIIPTSEIGLTCRYVLAQHPVAELIIGNGTCSAVVAEAILEANPGVSVVAVPEEFTTLQARRLYAQDHPARGLQRLLPSGMRVPPRPVDDYAAVALALAFLGK